mmetsp:Transcript_3757/g.8419  ORF Transcript_3757/g.8419 Transcript_3757/m.8419 type:complete len:97 (-) Transcript_3757:2-292(-)
MSTKSWPHSSSNRLAYSDSSDSEREIKVLISAESAISKFMFSDYFVENITTVSIDLCNVQDEEVVNSGMEKIVSLSISDVLGKRVRVRVRVRVLVR